MTMTLEEMRTTRVASSLASLEKLEASGSKPLTQDEKLALKLQRELNGLRRRGRSSRKKAAGAENPTSLPTTEAPTAVVSVSSKRKLEETESKKLNHQKKQRVASRPMVFHEDTQLWYRAQVVSRKGDEVEVHWDGLDERDFHNEWLSCSSERIWKGSMRNKDWKYVSGGGWLPKVRAGKQANKKRSKPTVHVEELRIEPYSRVQNPSTPPLVSPHNSCSEETSQSESLNDKSDLEETAQRISFRDCDTSGRTVADGESEALRVVIPTVKSEEKYNSRESSKPKPTRDNTKQAGQTSAHLELKLHSRFVKIKKERHDLPIKMLMKKAFRC